MHCLTLSWSVIRRIKENRAAAGLATPQEVPGSCWSYKKAGRGNTEVGGEIDAIIGIKYNNISPTPIHTLECGLTIYSLALETHNPEYNAVIGGPQSSQVILLFTEPNWRT